MVRQLFEDDQKIFVFMYEDTLYMYTRTFCFCMGQYLLVPVFSAYLASSLKVTYLFFKDI